MMPPFCIGTAARRRRLRHLRRPARRTRTDIATDCAKAVLDAGVDVAVSASMDVDHGTVQPLEKLFGDATARPGDTDLHQRRRPAARPAASLPGAGRRRRHLPGHPGQASADPRIRRALARPAGADPGDAPPAQVLERIVHGRPMTRRAAAGPAGRGHRRRQKLRRRARATCRRSTRRGTSLPGNRRRRRLAEFDAWSNSFVAHEGGSSAHEIRTWVAAFAALATQRGPTRSRPFLPSRTRTDRRFRHQNGAAELTCRAERLRSGTVDVLVVGSGGGGMTAALTAGAPDSTRWSSRSRRSSEVLPRCPAAASGCPVRPPSARRAMCRRPRRSSSYLKQITDGLVSDARLRQYVETAPRMLQFLEQLSPWFEFVWKPGYADYYPELPGGSELGSTINVPADRPAQVGRRGAEPAAAVGAGAEGNLVRPQGSAARSTRSASTGAAKACC